MMTEKEYIISSYTKHFEKFSQKNIVIYGIGKNTKIILDDCHADNIIGLMDESRAGESIFGLDIITMEQALERSVDLIVIVARASNVKVIFRRIAQSCAEHSIPVYDINGDEIVSNSPRERDYSVYDRTSLDILMSQIDVHDVVSFDIFDTLIYRDVLYPHDIFNLIERRVGKNFSAKRIAAEMDLYAEGFNPTLPEIYARMGEPFPIGLELDTEKRHLFRKPSGYAAYMYALRQGKQIFFVSDMYLSSDILHDILVDIGYDIRRNQILVSCECGASKSNGLFEILRQRASGSIIHIGDNLDADIDAARRYGIDGVFHLPSALQLLEDSYAASILEFDKTLENRCVIGRFLQAFFEDSFLFQRTRGKMEIRCSNDVAHFIAPFVALFYGWLLAEVRRQGLTHVLLSARDGRIIQKIHDYFCGLHDDLPLCDYFYVSRAVAVLAGIVSDEDILHGYRLAFSGSVQELLQRRFHLSADDLLPQGDADDESYVLAHRALIMCKAREARERFLRYIDTVVQPAESKVGFFDFISSGTCLKGLMNIIPTTLVGLFVSLVYNEADYKPEANISSMVDMTTFNVFKNSYNICSNYFLLENIFTSEEPSVCDFSPTGLPIFEEEKRTDAQIEDLKAIHEGILNYIKSMDMDIDGLCKIDLKLVDAIYGLFGAQYVECKCSYLDGLMLDDSFCQRTFQLDMNR